MVWTQTDWRHGCLYDKIWRRVRVGMQELWRWCSKWLFSSRYDILLFRVWLIGIDDFSLIGSRWISRSGGCSWHSHSTLQNAPTRKINFHQLYCFYLCLDQRTSTQSKTWSKLKIGSFCTNSRKSCHFYRWKGHYD